MSKESLKPLRINEVRLYGNLTRDPELKTLSNGTSLCSMGLAVDDSYKDKSGEKVDNAIFLDVTAWGKTAEICGEYLKKGRPVLVVGKLKMDTWEDKDSGKQRSKITINAFDVQSNTWGTDYSDDSPRGGKQGETKEPVPEDDIPF